MSPRLLPLLAIGVVPLACAPQPECGPTASCVSPELHVDACRTDPLGQLKLGDAFIGGVEDCSIDFGQVADAADRVVRLTNASLIEVHVDVRLASESGPFSLPNEPPSVVAPNQFADVTVHLDPLEPGPVSTLLTIASDAANFPAAAEGEIDVEIDAVVSE